MLDGMPQTVTFIARGKAPMTVSAAVGESSANEALSDEGVFDVDSISVTVLRSALAWVPKVGDRCDSGGTRHRVKSVGSVDGDVSLTFALEEVAKK